MVLVQYTSPKGAPNARTRSHRPCHRASPAARDVSTYRRRAYPDACPRGAFGGLHHLALSMEPEQWERIKAKLDAAGVAYQQIGRSLYFRDPDGTRLELLRDPLGEMNGKRVL